MWNIMLAKCLTFYQHVAHLSCWMKILSCSTVSNSLMCHWWHDFEYTAWILLCWQLENSSMVQKQYPISRYKDSSLAVSALDTAWISTAMVSRIFWIKQILNINGIILVTNTVAIETLMWHIMEKWGGFVEVK